MRLTFLHPGKLCLIDVILMLNHLDPLCFTCPLMVWKPLRAKCLVTNITLNGVVYRNKKGSKITLKYNVAESLVSRILVEYEPCGYNGVNKLGQAF